MISVIIPSYNGEALLKKYLNKNLQTFYKNQITEVIVIDDASTDGSIAYIRTHFPEVICLQNPINKGFSSSCNEAARVATQPLLWFLNNDMEVTDIEIDQIKKTFNDNQLFGLVGHIKRTQDTQSINESISIGYQLGGWFHAEIASSYIPDLKVSPNSPVLWCCGGNMIVDKKKFDLLNGFDETLFSPFYGEDLDLSYRAWQQGWSCLYNPCFNTLHQHQTTIKKHYKNSAISIIALTHMYLFTWKNCKSKLFLFSHFITVLVKCLTFQIKDTRAIIRALYFLPKIIQYRNNLPKGLKSDQAILTPFKQTVTKVLKVSKN